MHYAAFAGARGADYSLLDMTPLTLKVLPQALTVLRLEPDAAPPAAAMEGKFWSLTRTPGELSVVCESDAVIDAEAVEPGWRALEVKGPLDFGQVGILAGLSAALAVRDISIFAISTYDTDYILLKHDRLGEAVDALRDAGHAVVG